MIVLPAQPQFCPDNAEPADSFATACLWSDADGGVHQFEPGSGSQGIGSLIDQIKDMVTAPVESAASSIFDGFAHTMAQAFADVLQATMTWWLGPSGVALKPLLNTLSDPTGRNPAGLMTWLAAVVAVFALIGAGINLMLRRRMDDAVDVGIGLFKLALVYTAGWTVLLGLWNLSDELTNSILGNKGTAELSAPFTASMTVGIAAAPGLMIVLGLLGALLGLFLFFAMLFRIAAIVILAISLPLAAAGSLGTGATKDWLPKVTGWLLAFIMFRPVAALIYAIGLEIMTRSDTGDPVMGMFIGFAIMLTALISLGALMKLLSWTTGAAMSGGGGAGLAMAGAGVAGGMLMRMPGGAAAQASDSTGPTDPNPAAGGGGSGGSSGGGPSGAATLGRNAWGPAAQRAVDRPGGAVTGRSLHRQTQEVTTASPPERRGQRLRWAAATRSASPPPPAAVKPRPGAAVLLLEALGERAQRWGGRRCRCAAGGPVGIAAMATIQAANLGVQAVSSAATAPASEMVQ